MQWFIKTKMVLLKQSKVCMFFNFYLSSDAYPIWIIFASKIHAFKLHLCVTKIYKLGSDRHTHSMAVFAIFSQSVHYSRTESFWSSPWGCQDDLFIRMNCKHLTTLIICGIVQLVGSWNKIINSLLAYECNRWGMSANPSHNL